MICIDLGNGLTKIKDVNGKLIKFRSTIAVGRNTLNNLPDEVHKVKLGSTNMIIGAKDAETFPGERRYDLKYYEYCLLTAVALGSGGQHIINEEIKLNLPIRLFMQEEYQNKLKDFKHIKNTEITIDGEQYNITIKNVTPCAEGMLFDILSEKDIDNHINMVVDIGYDTVDVTVADGWNLTQVETFNNGIGNLYSIIAADLNCNICDVEFYYNRANNAIINYKKKDITKNINNGKITYVNSILRSLENMTDLSRIDKIYLIGGGAELIYKEFKKYSKNDVIKVNNSTFKNVEIFSNI